MTCLLDFRIILSRKLTRINYNSSKWTRSTNFLMASTSDAIFARQPRLLRRWLEAELWWYSIRFQSPFALLSSGFSKQVYFKTILWEVLTTNVTVFQRRHIGSSDSLQPCFPALNILRDLMVTDAIAFGWIIHTPGNTTVYHISLKSLDLSLYLFGNKSYKRTQEKIQKCSAKAKLYTKLPLKVWRFDVTGNCWPI